MSLTYIIDAYNLLNHPSFRLVEKSPSGAQRALLSFIRQNSLTGSPKNKIILVFDGFPPSGVDFSPEGAALFVFSRKISADEKIEKLIAESGRPKDIIVVSDDRQVQFMAKALRARVCAVAQFNADKSKILARDEARDEAKVSYTQIQEINEELRKRWLK